MSPTQSEGAARESMVDPLIDRARGGSRSSLGRLLATYRPYLVLVAYDQLRRAFHCKVSPSDVVQKTLHDAVVGIPSFRGTSQQEFVAWLLQILRHRVIDEVRRYSGPEQDIRREVSLERDSSRRDPLSRVLVDERRPDDHIAESEELHRLWQAADQLDLGDRSMLEFRFQRNLSIPEIAALLEITEGAARKRLQRAVRRLTAKVGNDGQST